MEEKIISYLEQYLENHPGYKVSDRLFGEYNNANHRLIAERESAMLYFRQVAKAHNYKINLDVLDGEDLQIQLTSEKGAVYSTYVFKKAIIPE